MGAKLAGDAHIAGCSACRRDVALHHVVHRYVIDIESPAEVVRMVRLIRRGQRSGYRLATQMSRPKITIGINASDA